MIKRETLHLTENEVAALKWMVDLLAKVGAPFQITGGFAARVYGAMRPLFDIDFDVPEEYFEKILPALKPYLIYGPENFKDVTWDLQLMTAQYQGVLIDIGGAYQTKCFDKNKQQWVDFRVDLSKATPVEVYGLKIFISPKESLVEYKAKIGRSVDFDDIKQITAP